MPLALPRPCAKRVCGSALAGVNRRDHRRPDVSSFILNPEGIEELLNGPEGFGAQVLGRAAIRVESQAKLNATGGDVPGAANPEGRGPKVRTDRLRSSITWVYGRDELGLFTAVGTNVYYGYYLEVGWTSSAGNFFSYPFLRPALSAV